jgi:hypothetical protein
MNAATHVKPSVARPGSSSLTSEHQHVEHHRFENLCEVSANCARTALDLILVGCVALALWLCLSSVLG